jgi:hypothetical protein
MIIEFDLLEHVQCPEKQSLRQYFLWLFGIKDNFYQFSLAENKNF